MKTFVIAAASLVFALAGYDVGIPYFSRTRNVIVAVPEKQNYSAIDGDVWKYARPDLSDLRLYDGASQVPYVLRMQSGGNTTQESEAKILNLGEVAGRAEFELDTSGFVEYDRIRLQLDARNFINSAQVDGQRTLNDRSGLKLGNSTLYDFTKEGLGSNFMLKFPAASFPFLHVRLAPGIRPDQVKGAYLSSFSETKAAWTSAGDCTEVTVAPRQTVYQCSIAEGMPVDRVTFAIPVGTVNFNRTVVLSDQHGTEFQSGSISRVRMNRSGQLVSSEVLAVDMDSRNSQPTRIAIENGDDPPLPIQRVQPLAVKRRMYFDSKGKSSLHLYYGDSKLEAPMYDYAKFFQQAADAAPAQLGPAQANPQFTGRPDDRPWSERHGIVLWAAMLLAVVVLGALALRGLKGNTTATL